MTRLYGVIGDPIAHSLSPLIHNGWYRDYGIGATYEALRVAEGNLSSALKTLADRGVKGLNVTLPHKQEALALSAHGSVRAEKIGAANTISLKDDRVWVADNTDAPGFIRSVRSEFPDVQLERSNIVIIGAGGSARAVIYALGEAGARLTLANRTLERAERVIAELGVERAEAIELGGRMGAIHTADLVVNTTSAGHAGDVLNLPRGDGRGFMDISYGKVARRQIEHAEARGWQSADGLGMLVAQAAESFSIWFGIEPDQTRAIARCRTALEMAS